MWICKLCAKKNGNNSRKCHNKGCPGTKPQELIEKENNQKTVRDFCPKCQSHQNFIQLTKKKFKCPRCKRQFKMTGKPVEEEKKVLKDNTFVNVEN